jgi:hypothetical protein
LIGLPASQVTSLFPTPALYSRLGWRHDGFAYGLPSIDGNPAGSLLAAHQYVCPAAFGRVDMSLIGFRGWRCSFWWWFELNAPKKGSGDAMLYLAAIAIGLAVQPSPQARLSPVWQSRSLCCSGWLASGSPATVGPALVAS